MVGNLIDIEQALELVHKRIVALEEKPNYEESRTYKKLRVEQDALYLLLERVKGGEDATKTN